MNRRLRSNGRAGACPSRKAADVKGEYQLDCRLVIHVKMLVMRSRMSSVSCWLEVSWHRHCVQNLQASYPGCHLTRGYLRHSSLYC
jgi:hypothetical protein